VPRTSSGFFPERWRRDFGAGFQHPSEGGGFKEFFEFIPSLARSCALSAVRVSTLPPAIPDGMQFHVQGYELGSSEASDTAVSVGIGIATRGVVLAGGPGHLEV
jgi:hypothetical protein